jgi:hypothetical protein
MSIKQLTTYLYSLERQRKKMLASFMLNEPLLIGSRTQTMGRCGKPNCQCAQKPSHPITLFMTTTHGKKRSQLIRKDDVNRILKLWRAYKNLVSLLRELKEIHQKEIELLRQIIRERSVDY